MKKAEEGFQMVRRGEPDREVGSRLVSVWEGTAAAKVLRQKGECGGGVRVAEEAASGGY